MLKTGNDKKTKQINNSTNNIRKRNDNAVKSKKVLTIIPRTIENPTSPCLYSFLRGRKKVRTRSRKEKRFKKDLLKEAKAPISLNKVSIYQNFKRRNG